MALTNAYIDVDDFKESASIGTSKDDSKIEAAIAAASRRIDTWCDRHFYKDGTSVAPVARTFTARDSGLVYIDDLAEAGAEFVLKSDDNDDGTFETTWASSDYVLERDLALSSYPYSRIRTRKSGAKSFPTRYLAVQVTGIFGWPSVPEEVVQACRILANRLFKRKDAPFAQLGTAETGLIKITSIDPDVEALLAPFRASSGLA